jgi:hypothetical protein
VGQLQRRGGGGAGGGVPSPRAQGGRPRHGPRGDRVGPARGRGHHRARLRAGRAADGRHDPPGRVLVPDHLRGGLCGRGPRGGGRADLEDHGGRGAPGLRPGGPQGREDQLRDRRRRVPLDGEPGPRALVHGPLRHDAHAGHPVGDLGGRGAAGPAGQPRLPRARPIRRL